jgi:hypothetical protein
MVSHQNIFKGRHIVEKADILEGSGNAEVGDHMALEPFYAFVHEKDIATLYGIIDAGQTIKKGGFPCAVGAYKPRNHALINFKINTIEGDESPKLLIQALCF